MIFMYYALWWLDNDQDNIGKGGMYKFSLPFNVDDWGGGGKVFTK